MGYDALYGVFILVEQAFVGRWERKDRGKGDRMSYLLRVYPRKIIYTNVSKQGLQDQTSEQRNYH